MSRRTQIFTLGGLGFLALTVFCALTVAIYLLLSSRQTMPASANVPVTTPVVSTVVAQRNDEEIGQCIKKAFESSEYGDYANFNLDLLVEVNKEFVPGLRNPRRVVRTEDPKQEVWIIEAMYDFDAVTTGGKCTETEIWQEALFDRSTGRLTIPQEHRQAYAALGGDTQNLRLNLKKTCPNLE